MSKLKSTTTIKELKAIAAANNGLLKPETVVAVAKSKKSRLHSYFEWDNTKAAREYRLQQARRLISVCVEYIGTESHGQETRVFVNLRDDREDANGYRPLVTVLSDKELRRSLLADALEELAYFRQKYGSLKELSRIFEAMDGLDGESKAA